MSDWVLGEEHEMFGRVAMMRTIEGEPYRFFIDTDKVVSMIPLSVLQEQEEVQR
ncbi:hypothetical protein LCGC14_1670970 [marine sediment metagenome]|uniref:Uncharacterized protein n=1 Tax=marine sediment metagenome TaxID=412755 RepID=A0A0F9K750_9ZZZZ